MKKAFKTIDNIISWILLLAMMFLLISSVSVVLESKKTGEPAFILGYRPIIVFTGSMEPYLMTNGMALTKEVDSMEEIQEGDVISFHVVDDTGKTIRITHRITDIDEQGVITTKGDNNNVVDSYPLTLDNVESKVVFTMNFTAWIARTWQTARGKFTICSMVLAAILVVASVKLFIKDTHKKKVLALPDPTESEKMNVSVNPESKEDKENEKAY